MKSIASTRFRIIIITLTALMIAFVFIHSLLPATVSDQESEGVLDFIYNILTSIGINAEINNHIIRKLAHFTEFTALGMMLTSCAYSFNRFKPYKYSVHIFFAGLCTAVIDETIQLFVEGRSGQITDVLLDFSGIVTGTAIMILFYIIYIRIRKRKNESGS